MPKVILRRFVLVADESHPFGVAMRHSPDGPWEDVEALREECGNANAELGRRPDAAALIAAPQLAGKSAVVCYFPTDQDRDEFVASMQEAVPGMRAENIRGRN